MKTIYQLRRSVKKYGLIIVLLSYCHGSDAQKIGAGDPLSHQVPARNVWAMWPVDLPQWVILLLWLGVLGLLLYVGYKMYYYKVALKEAQKTNASLLKIFHKISGETHVPFKQPNKRLHHLMAQAQEGEEKENRNLVLLKTRLSEVMLQKKGALNLKERQEHPASPHKNHKIGSADKKIIENFTHLMQEHLGDENLTHDTMASMLGLSRSLYYEKIKNLIGLTPNEYLKNIRMHEAAHLLQEGEFTVSEVMLKVGFRDPKYFRDCFKKRYGKSPLEYTKFCQASYTH